MIFNTEKEFEDELISTLIRYGWSDNILTYPTENDLIENWRQILSRNNSGIDQLNDMPLTESEMQQVLDQVNNLQTPLKVNEFINGISFHITRDNPDDKAHYGKEVSLKIYDRNEIAGGKSTYQIARQPIFHAKKELLNSRRGDLMLLINGMPVIHIELKKNGVPVSQACEQIAKYAHEGVFTGIFSLVQIFVAMEPEETLYFANPGRNGFNPAFYFHWADKNNIPMNDWTEVVENLLSIPMAHKLIGFYTIADDTDGNLKVLRSYQYHAANAIADKIKQTDWADSNQLGGYIWHTTGSGKTMTSFKAAQLIADSNKADKVIFLTDRIELGVQSLNEYKGFADDDESVEETENTADLLGKLTSQNTRSKLIVTSIQKMSNIAKEEYATERDLEIINSKRLVFIVDEAHRSTFGDMLISIKKTFPYAIFFGFTGTPIFDENSKKSNTTVSVFGNELHRYTIADGMRDGNVLGFDLVFAPTYNIEEVRESVALHEAGAQSIADVYENEKKIATFELWMDHEAKSDLQVEEKVPASYFNTDEHRTEVVKDVKKHWPHLSSKNKFHALFATSSIAEAIAYAKLFRDLAPEIKSTALFDPSILNEEGAIAKEDGLVEILTAYNNLFGQTFNIPNYALFKKDVANRLSHKGAYKGMKENSEDQLDLLIVVDQMLTGFDSKWLNTLYLDKTLEYENVIQAFSRTNRIYNKHLKQFGTIKCFRYTNRMKESIRDALKLYSGDIPTQLFVDHLVQNIQKMNACYAEIKYIFDSEHIENFASLPKSKEAQAKFSKEFSNLEKTLEAARVQGFDWYQIEYDNDEEVDSIAVDIDEDTFNVLLQRYKELAKEKDGDDDDVDIPIEIDSYIANIDTKRIDFDYMNSHFERFIEQLNNDSQEDLNAILCDLHRSFASLSQEEQMYADIIIRDAQAKSLQIRDSWKLSDYITHYMKQAENKTIDEIVQAFGINRDFLKEMTSLHLTEQTINVNGRLSELVNTLDLDLARNYFESQGQKVPPFKIRARVQSILTDYIINGKLNL